MEVLKKRKKLKSIGFFMVMFFSIGIFVYVDSYRSDAYKFAENYLLYNEDIERKFGDIENVKLKPFGIEIEEVGLFGSASFNVDIYVKKAKRTLSVKLKKVDGVWILESVEEKK